MRIFAYLRELTKRPHPAHPAWCSGDDTRTPHSGGLIEVIHASLDRTVRLAGNQHVRPRTIAIQLCWMYDTDQAGHQVDDREPAVILDGDDGTYAMSLAEAGELSAVLAGVVRDARHGRKPVTV